MSEITRAAAAEPNGVPDVPGLVVSAPREGVALVEFDRPHRRNALDRPLLDGLPVVLRSLNRSEEVRAIVVSGRGGAFCAGGDLSVIGEMQDESPREAADRMAGEFESASLLVNSPKITLAAVAGPAVGAGLALALACDVRVGSDEAMFSAPFARMALVPDFGVSWLLARTVGASTAVDVAVSGRRVAAAEALRCGMLTELAADPLDRALTRAEAFAGAVPRVAASTKRLIRNAMTADFDASLAAEIEEQLTAIGSPEFRENLAAWTAAVRGG